MLLQTGLLVRVVNKMTRGSSFISIEIYITKGFITQWYPVHQPNLNDKKVEIPYSLIADHGS